VTALAGTIETLNAVATPAEKRQLVMVSKAQQELEAQLARGEVAEETLKKLQALVSNIQGRNFQMATKIQADLAATVWTKHSAWLKGIKMLITICTKH
jgi:hypothetical protein